MCNRTNETGQTLLEVIVAATVGILVVSALTFAVIFSLRNASFAKNQAQATKLAQEGIEKVRSISDRDEAGTVIYQYNPGLYTSKFSDLWGVYFNCPLNCYYYFNSSGILTGGTASNSETIVSFKRQILIEDQSLELKKITAVVIWSDFAGSHESKLTTILRKL